MSGQRYVQFIMTFTAGLFMAGSLFAQASGGNVYGTAVDKSGSAVPGVTITLSGVGAPRTFVTDSQGQFRFLNISPGKYLVRGELEGFSTIQRPIDVAIGASTDVELKFSPAVAETITVSAVSPVIDRRETGTSTHIEEIELKEVPTARDPWVVLQSVPGILVDRVNVGGNKSGQQSQFVGKGVERNQTVWNIDGVNSTDMSAGGAAGFYLDFDSFQEFSVVTGSTDPSVQTPGVQVNMVSKRGTNDLRGSGRFFWTSNRLQTDPKAPAEGAQYGLTVVNSINRISEAGFEAGGPLMRDRLWLWGSYSKNPINTVVSGSSTRYQKTDLWNYNGKLNAQLASNNAGYAGYMYSNKTVVHRSIGPSRPVETSYNQSGPGWQWTFEDTHNFSQSFYTTGRVGWIVNGYNLDPVGGMGTQMYWDAKAVPHGSYKNFKQSMPQRQFALESSKFFSTGSMNHELKFGFGYRRTPIRSSSAYPGDQTWVDFSQTTSNSPLAVIGITRQSNISYGSNYRDAFVGDTMILGNLTLNAGLRYDIQRAKNNPTEVPANPAFPNVLPAVSFAGDTKSLEWKGVAPRIGATYALGRVRRVLLRGGYSRYIDQIQATSVSPNNPFYNIQIIYYSWNDANGDKQFQKNELGVPVLSARFVDPANPASGISTGRVDYGVKPPKTDEFLAGIEREIGSAFAVGLNYTYRKRTDLLWTAYEKTRGAGNLYTPADFEINPSQKQVGTLPNGQQYSVDVYRLKSGIPRPLYTVTTNRPDYHQTYHGLELTATKRMQNHWMLRGNLTFTDWKQHVGPRGIMDPTPLMSTPTGGFAPSCDTCVGSTPFASANGSNGFINSRWSTAINGVYELPLQMTFGAAFVGRQGYIIPYYRRVRDAAFGNKRVLIGSFDDFRLDNLYQLDLRLAKRFALVRGTGLEISADLFNATNQNTVLWRDDRLYSLNGPDLTSGNNNIQEIQSPRIWRLGVRLTF
jgi:hypothetical protein